MSNPELVKSSFPSIFESSAWTTTEEYFQYYGIISALIGGAILPIHPFLFVGCFSNTNLTKLIGALTIGRFGRNFIVCYLTAKAERFRRNMKKPKEE